jgi:hypothetical protein
LVDDYYWEVQMPVGSTRRPNGRADIVGVHDSPIVSVYEVKIATGRAAAIGQLSGYITDMGQSRNTGVELEVGAGDLLPRDWFVVWERNGGDCWAWNDHEGVAGIILYLCDHQRGSLPVELLDRTPTRIGEREFSPLADPTPQVPPPPVWAPQPQPQGAFY